MTEPMSFCLAQVPAAAPTLGDGTDLDPSSSLVPSLMNASIHHAEDAEDADAQSTGVGSAAAPAHRAPARLDVASHDLAPHRHSVSVGPELQARR